MASTLVERAWREAAPESVEHELAAMWRELARLGTVARAVMSNLVVFRYHERRLRERSPDRETRDGAFTDLLNAVVARHPSRAIVIEHDRGQHDTGAPIGAGVGISIFGPPAARYGVESIVVRSACAEASLPSIVRRFMRGGLPTSVWWTDDLSVTAPLPSLATMARQLIFDSGDWRNVAAGVRSLMGDRALSSIDLADLNWRRLRPLRTALVHAAGSCGRQTVDAGRVRIQHAPAAGALAWLLAGWLASRLDWPPDAWPEIVPAETGARVTLTIRDADFVLAATLDETLVRVDVTDRPSLVLPAGAEDPAEAVAAELRTLARELELRDALRALARYFDFHKPG
jgi:glucose-6-phosphate dehydrogenase assembly protein OpcA